MAKIDDIGKFLTQVQKDVFGARGMMDLGEMAKDIIFKRVKSGKGVDSDTAEDPREVELKPLSPSYVTHRTQVGVRGSFGSPSRSNLTFTGNLLDSMVVTSSEGEFDLTIPNSRRDSDNKTNAQVAKKVAQAGRPFFALSADERQILRKDIEETIRRAQSKSF